ncbi:MAG: right-handed parallel beta-helix repeat-containing protein [Terrimicrobiaceae bacterium]
MDFSTNTLFLWPRDANSEIIITQTEGPLIDVRDASDLSFEGLVLEHSLGDGIVMENVTRCRVAGCTIRDLAGRGVVIHGVKSGVQSCDIYNIGKGAVTISGGDRKTLTKSENYVLNNHLHHYGVLKSQYSAGVHVGATDNPVGPNAVRDAVGIRVANNAIHHAPRDAVLYSGNDNVYELNEIYYCGYDTADVGAFYSWLDWTMRGNIIRHNFMHETVGGVNPDDGASGNLVYGNIFAGSRTGVWIASGPDNIIRHNVFIKDEGSVFGMDDRGTSRGYATNPRLLNRLQEINPTEDPWKSAHPEVANMLDNRPDLPWRTQFVGNLSISKNPKPSELKMKAELKTNPEILTEKENVTIAEDPGILAAAHARQPAGPESEVLRQIPGFEPIPFEKIGLQIDNFRPRLPTDEEASRRPQDSPFPKEKDLNFGT